MIIDGVMLMIIVALLGVVTVSYLAIQAKLSESARKISEARFVLALAELQVIDNG